MYIIDFGKESMKKKKNRLNMKKIILFLCFVFKFCFSGVAQPTPADRTGFSYPMTVCSDSNIYFCAQYDMSYKRVLSYLDNSYYKELKEVCTCHTSSPKMLEWNIKFFSNTVKYTSVDEIFIWDKDFINYIIQEYKKERGGYSKSTKKALKMLECTIANSDDNTFIAKNIIDFDNKVVINDKMYYYPLKIESWVSISVNNPESFFSMVPKSSFIFYEQNCFDDENVRIIGMNLLIPVLDECDVLE